MQSCQHASIGLTWVKSLAAELRTVTQSARSSAHPSCLGGCERARRGVLGEFARARSDAEDLFSREAHAFLSSR